MDLTSFAQLLTPYGQEALQFAENLEPREIDYLLHFQKLSRVYPSELAQAALETAILRNKARTKFPQAEKMYFTREALEQASPFQVSAYRVERYRHFEFLVDLGCSIGGDTINLADIAPTLGIDSDPLRLALAQANAGAMAIQDEVVFVCADLAHPLPLRGDDQMGVFFDPGRRVGGQRVYSVHRYSPPLSIIENWLDFIPALGVKVSPGVNKTELASFDAELEFISLDGKLKEGVLWFGPLKTTQMRATVLPGRHSLMTDEIQETLPLSEPLAYLYEPDPAVIRAGLVAALGRRLGASQLDAEIAYLTAENLQMTPFANAWTIEDWMPFSLKKLRAYLRERGVGRIVVKKRGSPLQPQELIQKLRLKGEAERVVFLTHLDGRPITVVCTPS
jgi:hypothetical protein